MAVRSTHPFPLPPPIPIAIPTSSNKPELSSEPEPFRVFTLNT